MSGYISPTRRKKIERLQSQCDNWNAKYPVGTRVKYFAIINPREDCRGEFTTRTEAQILGDHTPVIWLNGHSGCVALEACEPVEPEPKKYVSPFVKDDRVQLVDDWYDHPLHGKPDADSPKYEPARGEVGTVVATPRKVYEDSADVSIKWDRDPRQRRTRWGDLWLKKVEAQS